MEKWSDYTGARTIHNSRANRAGYGVTRPSDPRNDKLIQCTYQSNHDQPTKFGTSRSRRQKRYSHKASKEGESAPQSLRKSREAAEKWVRIDSFQK